MSKYSHGGVRASTQESGGDTNFQSTAHGIPDDSVYLGPYSGNSKSIEGKEQSPVVKSVGFHIRQIQI